MTMYQRALLVDPATGFYRTRKYGMDRYFGPVDLGIHINRFLVRDPQGDRRKLAGILLKQS